MWFASNSRRGIRRRQGCMADLEGRSGRVDRIARGAHVACDHNGNANQSTRQPEELSAAPDRGSHRNRQGSHARRRIARSRLHHGFRGQTAAPRAFRPSERRPRDHQPHQSRDTVPSRGQGSGCRQCRRMEDHVRAGGRQSPDGRKQLPATDARAPTSWKRLRTATASASVAFSSK